MRGRQFPRRQLQTSAGLPSLIGSLGSVGLPSPCLPSNSVLIVPAWPAAAHSSSPSTPLNISLCLGFFLMHKIRRKFFFLASKSCLYGRVLIFCCKCLAAYWWRALLTDVIILIEFDTKSEWLQAEILSVIPLKI